MFCVVLCVLFLVAFFFVCVCCGCVVLLCGGVVVCLCVCVFGGCVCVCVLLWCVVFCVVVCVCGVCGVCVVCVVFWSYLATYHPKKLTKDLHNTSQMSIKLYLGTPWGPF
mgnify:CR=1 FL=1